MLLDRLLVAYSHVPNHPGKGKLYDRLMPLAGPTWTEPRLRTRYGVRFECDMNDKLTREIYYTGFDNRDCRVLRNLVKPGDVILDAGANIGYFTLLCAKWLRGRGAVHAFEPFPETYARLERNVNLNPRLRSITHLHRLALSDFTGAIGMSTPDRGNRGCNFLDPAGEHSVGVTTIDAFCEEGRVDRVSVIKIDVEGSEVALLREQNEPSVVFGPF